jgi:hypothetical protein
MKSLNQLPDFAWSFIPKRNPERRIHNSGLGMRPDVVDAILVERDTTRSLSEIIKRVDALAPHGGDRKSEAFGDQGSERTLIKRGETSKYLAARIKRDAPEIAARIEDFPSIRAAAKAAGIVREPSAMDLVRKGWWRRRGSSG